MEILHMFIATVIIVSAIAVLGFLDKKYQLGLSASSELSYQPKMNNHGSHITAQFEQVISTKNKEIKELQERVNVLERIVTDPKEQLLREIDRL